MRNWIFSGIFTLFLVGYLCIYIYTDKQEVPTPTEIVEEKEGNYKDRLSWFDEMHRAEAGLNWQMQDINYRLNRSRHYASSFRRSSNSISLADGLVKGSWFEKGSKNQSGRIHLAEYDTFTNEIISASSGGNIWIGNLDGSNWKNINDQFKIPDIISVRVLYVNNNRRILVSSGKFGIEGVYYTDNDGKNWQMANGLANIANWGNIHRMVIPSEKPNHIYLLAQEWDATNWEAITSIYKSTSSGDSFTQILSFSSATYGSVSKFDLWCNYYNSSNPYLLINNEINIIQADNQLSTVGSASYNENGNVYLCGYQDASATVLYIAVKQSSGTAIYKSADGGSVWTYQSDVSESPFRRSSFCCSSTNPNNLYFGGVNCYRSYNGGAGWTQVNLWSQYYGDPENLLHADIPGINSFVILDKEKVFISTDGGLYVSNDSLKSVKNLSLLNHNVSQYYSTYTCRFDPNVVHAGSQDQGYQRSLDPGNILSFKQIISGDYGHIVSGDLGSSIWMVYPGFAIYYPNINLSTSSKRWDFAMSGNFWIPPLLEDTNDPTKVYLAGGSSGSGSHIFHLSYNGVSVSAIEGSFNFSRNNSKISAMEYSPLNTDIRYVVSSKGDFYLSTDAGINWTLQSFTPDFGAHYFYGADILASTKDTATVYIAGSGYSNPGVYVSHDYGKTFTALDSNLPSTLFYKIVTDKEEKYLFAATEVGPFVFALETNTWYDLAEGIAPDQNYWSVDYIPAINTVRFGTYGRGIWDFVLCDSSEAWVTASFSKHINFLDVQFQNTSINADSFYWDFGDGNFSNSENPSHSFPTGGNYEVKLFAINSCFTDSIVIDLSVYSIGIKEQKTNAAIQVYPNPSNGKFSLSYHTKSAEIRDISIQIVDLKGQQIYTENCEVNNSNFFKEFNFAKLSSGIYLIRIEDAGVLSYQTVLIQ
ncbi:MAG: T9SS type A sorting domain-containing protein [Bacteroidetes bacterium]|jgi:photosystem II stability/assembly factor-like uncharacterized protein|nr:T9SS type A sorting domain-containing protein [Bacteroidota bacterium]MBT5527773.1 T9SS type A sorting domain-containing protein [Cytophagia bacterium]MBT3422413.1 T9SS type A sorting domain-containing protein [Bacteroidota bacterium]MBT3935610.1 T9SS type A sorting domain-containing protein [Bacteroidota bacterium]MBT4338956.1 T9SS type A sorting domain-containing protein [Bacteroidota bacterium]